MYFLQSKKVNDQGYRKSVNSIFGEFMEKGM